MSEPSSNFLYAIPFILQHEGGLCNVSGDAGGLTKYGISQRSYPDLDIASLTVEQATDIYQRDFWQDSWDSLDKRVAAKVFDFSVNAGESWGPKILQRSLGCKDDGIVGPQTLSVANLANVDALLQVMCDQIKKHYSLIVQAHPEDAKFINGWDARAEWIPPAT